jgi:hypothetical protein
VNYTDNYNLRKPELTDPVDIDDLNYNADEIDSLLKGLADGLDGITPEGIGAETPTGAQQKANQAETNAKSYADIVANGVLNSAKDYADIVTNNALNSAKDYADGVLESANSHTDQVASDLSQKLNETRIKVLDVEQDVSNINKVLINLNPNHEAKQTVSGYGTVTLPKNAANGQISVTVKGNTETDEEGNTKSTVGAMRIKSVGKNLFDGKWELGAFHGTTGALFPATDRIRVKNFIKVKPNTAYSLTISGTGGNAVVGYDINKNNVYPIKGSSLLYIYSTSQTYIGFITGENVHYLKFMTLTTDFNTTAQLEEGVVLTAYEPYTESTQYLPNVGELRSLPNGTKDEIRVSDGKLIKKIKEYVLQASDITQIYTNASQVNYVWIKKPLDFIYYDSTSSNGEQAFNVEGYKNYVYGSGYDNIENIGCIGSSGHNNYFYLITSKEMATLEQARAELVGKALNYQLATPIEIPIQTSGSLVSYPSGTVYIEPFVADAGIYTDKMSVLHQDLPIKVLEKLLKIDFMTGLETELDVSDAIIAEDKLSFTHPDLVDGDIVFFTYEYDRESTEGETEIEYYDSRYVIIDSVTGKIYKWQITVENGVPSIELTEV